MRTRKLFFLGSPIEQSDKRRLIYFYCALICFVLGLLLVFTYRPFIYSNHINDWHLADTIGNIVAVPAAAFSFYAWHKSIRYTKLTILVLVFFIWCFYEVVFSQTFDWWDIFATTIMCFVTYPILQILENRIVE